MLMYMVVEGVEAGKGKLDTPISVTERAQGMGGTQVLVKAGDVWPLEHLMRGVAVASANDAAMAVARGTVGERGGVPEGGQRARRGTGHAQNGDSWRAWAPAGQRARILTRRPPATWRPWPCARRSPVLWEPGGHAR